MSDEVLLSITGTFAFCTSFFCIWQAIASWRRYRREMTRRGPNWVPLEAPFDGDPRVEAVRGQARVAVAGRLRNEIICPVCDSIRIDCHCKRMRGAA